MTATADRQQVGKYATLSRDYLDEIALENLPGVLLEEMRRADPHATLENTTVEIDIDHDFYTNCSCHAEVRLKTRRLETDEELAARLKADEAAKQAKRKVNAERRKEREENERKTYERLKAKFEKPAKRSKP
jgi:hypothetical protein